LPEPLYVVEVRPRTREVVVGTREELGRDLVEVAELNWLTDPPEEGERVRVQLRYRAPAVTARIAASGETLELALDEPHPAVSPGQSAVVFRNTRVLGGGRIDRKSPRLNSSHVQN